MTSELWHAYAGTRSARLRVDGARLVADLEALSAFGRRPGGAGIDRPSFSPADRAARAWLRDRCEASGLVWAEDGMGNARISSPRLEEGIAHLPAVWSGSHIDTVPNGGAYDGAVGSLAAIECLRRLHEEGASLARPYRAVVYADEEGNYAHLLGSNALVRGYAPEEVATFEGRDGDRLVEAFAAAGGDPARVGEALLPPGALHATVELHIEQGPIMEQRGVEIGVVTGIVSIGGGVVTFRGRADHAGTTPMTMRRDAAVAAGELVAWLPRVAPLVSRDAVATSGIVRFEPGGSNVVPELAHVTVDFRDPAFAKVVEIEDRIESIARDIARRHGLEVAFEFEPILEGATMDEGIRSVIAAAAAASGCTVMDIPSGAGHDSQNMARIAPTGMIFVPSAGGRSHCPDEFTAAEDLVRGADVLLGTILQLAG